MLNHISFEAAPAKRIIALSVEADLGAEPARAAIRYLVDAGMLEFDRQMLLRVKL